MGRPHRWNAIAFLRLNSFDTVRHHRDVVLYSFTDCSPFVAAIFSVSFRETKNPAYFAVSRVREKFVFDLQNLPTPSLSKLPSGRCPMVAEDIPWLNAQP